MQGLRFQKLGITNKREIGRSPCRRCPAGAKLGIINIVSHGIADDNHNGRGTPDYEKQEAMK